MSSLRIVTLLVDAAIMTLGVFPSFPLSFLLVFGLPPRLYLRNRQNIEYLARSFTVESVLIPIRKDIMPSLCVHQQFRIRSDRHCEM